MTGKGHLLKTLTGFCRDKRCMCWGVPYVQVQYGKHSQELKRPATSTIADLKAEVGSTRA